MNEDLIVIGVMVIACIIVALVVKKHMKKKF